jgi:hypothetical protein
MLEPFVDLKDCIAQVGRRMIYTPRFQPHTYVSAGPKMNFPAWGPFSSLVLNAVGTSNTTIPNLCFEQKQTSAQEISSHLHRATFINLHWKSLSL